MYFSAFSRLLRFALPVVLGAMAVCRPHTSRAAAVENNNHATSSMNETPNESLRLTAELRESTTGKLFPEQSAAFTITLRNAGDNPQEVLSLSGNQRTPVFRALNSNGDVLVEGDPQKASDRVAGEVGEPQPMPDRLKTLQPGTAETTWVNLWNFVDPLPMGKYRFEVEHMLRPGPETKRLSGQVPFEIIPGTVSECATGYEGESRMTSVMAWLVAPKVGDHEPELLVRLSGFGDHAIAQQGGTSHGFVKQGSRLAVAQRAAQVRGMRSWIGVLTGSQVILIRHDMTLPVWRSDPIDLPGDSLSPVPRFPDRNQAVFLATGKKAGAGILAGVTVKEKETEFKPWSLPLANVPNRTACIFDANGTITLCYAAEDGDTTRFFRLQFDEEGTLVTAEQEFHSTANVVLGLVAEMRPGVSPGFVITEADPEKHDQLKTVRVKAQGDPVVNALPPVAGWPAIKEGETERPLPATAVAMEVSADGAVWLLVVDEKGCLFGGRIDQSFSVLDSASGVPRLFPHIASLRGGQSVSWFDSNGVLVHAGGSSGGGCH